MEAGDHIAEQKCTCVPITPKNCRFFFAHLQEKGRGKQTFRLHIRSMAPTKRLRDQADDAYKTDHTPATRTFCGNIGHFSGSPHIACKCLAIRGGSEI